MNFAQLTQDLTSPNFLSWCGSGLFVVGSLDAVVRLWTERHRLVKDELNHEDRAFAWRLVIFLVLPLLMWIDLRSTDIALNLAGGYMGAQTYGFIWYQATLEGLAGINPSSLAAVYIAGEVVQIAFALALIPALFFRPHPFLASFLGYAIAFALGFNLIGDPILSLAGFGLPRWPELLKIGMTQAPLTSSIVPALVAAHCALSGLYLFFMTSGAVRMWFSDLTRPQTSLELQELKISLSGNENSSSAVALKLGLLYVRAGLLRPAGKILKQMQSAYPQSICTSFFKALIAFQQRNFKQARAGFIAAADLPQLGVERDGVIDSELKASLFAAAACSAYALGDIEGALNLCDRALEFEDACLTARLVKVDAYLAKGKKEQAAQEIMVAMHLGLDFDLKDRVPVDLEEIYALLVGAEERVERVNLLGQVERLEATLEK